MTQVPVEIATGILTALGLILGGLLSERRLWRRDVRIAEAKRLALAEQVANVDVDAIMRRRGIPTRDSTPYAEYDFSALFAGTPEVGTGGVVRRVVERPLSGKVLARVEYEGGHTIARAFACVPLRCRCDGNPPHARFCRSCGRPVPPPVDTVCR